MDFDGWLGKAWDDHGNDALGVAARLGGEGLAHLRDGDDVAALARLAHHVCGEHLARWDEGRALLAALGRHAHGAAAAPTLRVLDASLALCAGDVDPRPALGESERIRVTALAAGNLTGHDPARAGALLREAIADADGAVLDDRDPACRALAVTGNNMACALEEKAVRSEEERSLMILAARTGRQYWARAGTWLETERAEYRLAQARAAFAGLDANDRASCQASLDALAG